MNIVRYWDHVTSDYSKLTGLDVGYYCWMYPEDNNEFSNWMKTNMIGPWEADWRFNSGSPMFTVYMANDDDAMLFKLRWM